MFKRQIYTATKKSCFISLLQMDSYLKPDEKIEKYEEKYKRKKTRSFLKKLPNYERKKRRRIRAKNFKPERILLHVTHTKDGKKRKSLDFKNKCVIL